MKTLAQLTPKLFLAAALLAAGLPSASARDAAKANEVLLKATSPYEDMVEFALAKNADRVAKSLAQADSQAAAVKESLRPGAVAEFERRVQELHQAVADREHYAVAVGGVEIFRLLIDNLDADKLKVPKEVSLLDYAGFKLHVLDAAPRRDWDAMRKTVADSVAWWDATKAKVKDRSLRSACHSAIRGLQEAGKSENRALLHFAAQMELDLVDLLENHFEGK